MRSFCVNKLSSVLYLFVFCCFYRSKDIIRRAIKDNDFLGNLEQSQIQELVECMYQMEFKKGDYIIREGEPGSHLYCIEGMLDYFRLHRRFKYWLNGSLEIVGKGKIWFSSILFHLGLTLIETRLHSNDQLSGSLCTKSRIDFDWNCLLNGIVRLLWIKSFDNLHYKQKWFLF